MRPSSSSDLLCHSYVNLDRAREIYFYQLIHSSKSPLSSSNAFSNSIGFALMCKL